MANYDYIFRVGADASGIAQEVIKQMDSAKSFVSGNDLMIKFTGDQKSIQDILKKIKGMAPEAEITFATDPKNLESLLTGLTDGVKKGIKRANITDEVKKAFEELRSYATGTFKDVNLTSYFSEIAEGFTDSSKSANQLLDAIRIAKGELDDLASISNRSSFQFMNTNQLRQLVTLARSRRDVQLQYDEAVKEANKQQDKYSLSKSDIKSRIQGRGYPKKMGSETAEKLGISDKYNKADSASQALMQDYAHTAKLLDVMIAKKKEFSDISTTRDAENFLKQSKEIFDVYMRLVGLEDEVAKAFKIPKDERGNLLTSMIEQDGEKVTRRNIANELAAAQDAYTKIRTKTLHNAVQNADQDIANYIKQNSQKQVERSEKAANVSAERADRDIERAQSRKRVSHPKSDVSGISEEYEGATDSAEEFEGAAVRAGTAVGNSAENASEEVKQLRKQIEDAEQELQKLQKGTSLKDALSKDKTGTMDSLLGELKQLNDEYMQLDGNIPEEKLKRFGSLYEAISRVDVDKVEPFDDNYYAILEKFDESGDGEFEFPQLTKIVDESAISRQIQVIDELKAKLHNLTSQTGELGSGEGVGGTGKEIGISVDNEKALENIREVQNQLNTLPDEKNIKITLDIPDVKSSDLLNRFKELQDLYSADAVNEYGLAFNDKTGVASEVVAGKGRSVKTSSIVQGMGGTANSVLHTHPDVTIPAFSTSEIENLYKELESGITRQFVKAGKQIAMLDISQLSEKNIGAKELKSQISSEMLKATISHQQEMYSRFGLENILPDNYADVLREKIRHSLVDSLNNAGIPADESIGKLENELVENIVNNIKSRINSKDVYGNGIVTDEISDIIHELVVEPLKKIHLDNDAINELEADIAGNVGDLPGEKTLKSLQLNKNNVQRINQIAMRSALSNLGIEDVSSVFKVMDEKDWLSSVYPQIMQEPIKIKVDTSKAESQIDELTKPRTIKIDTEINDNNETTEKRTETKQVHEVRRKIAGDNGEVVTRTEKGTTETTGTAQTVPAPDTSRIEETANEISKLKSDVQSAAQSVSSAMNDIATSSGTAATAVSNLNDQISRLSEAKNIIDDVAKPIKADVKETGNKVVDIKTPVDDAAQSKESFTEANKGVTGSISSSVNGLQQEANMFDQTAQSAKEAADAKEQFVKANQQVKDSANATAAQPQTKEKSEAEKAIEYYKELERNAGKFREYQKKVEEYGRGVLVNDTQRGEYDHLADIYAKAEAAAEKYGSTVEGLRESQEKYKNTLKDIEDAEAKISAQKKQSDDTRIFNTATKKTSDRLSRISTQDQERWASQYQNLRSAIESATTAFENTGAIDDYNSAVDRAFNTFERFSKMPSGKIVDQTFGSLDDAKSYFEGIVNSYKTVQKGLSGSTQIDSNGIAQWSAQVRDAEGNVERLGVTWDSVTGRMVMSSKQMPHQLVGISGLIDGVKNKVKELATYWTARLFDPMDIVRYAKQIIGVVQEYDDALTEMRKVSEESVSSLKSFQVDSFSKANEVGTTAIQLQQSTADWLRLGESFTEAQKSAMQSNILLNVSEFSNISDATESLVSMSQAYKELDKSEIIDRLNNVGNNFSISTSDLAESLKKSSGTLKLAGNTIDEAIALTTAGNAILQDPNTVGTGLKMISLRLTGTKAAAEELAAMGEDVDGMITTQSKLRQTIMDATKVESNNFKGFDILDDNGNYKSTFEILRGISEIYKEIQETDEKYGQNNKNLLLETVAGKNRSSVAASIFSDPQLLNDVYEASQQSQGSAQKELDKYLDSITGKMQKLQNTLHEITSVTIDSEGFKVLLDIVNALLSGVGSLIKTFGGLNIVIGSIAGIFAQRKGWNVKDFGKGILNLFSGSGKNVGKALGTQVSSGILNGLKDISKTNGSLTINEFIKTPDFGNIDTELQGYLAVQAKAGKGNQQLAQTFEEVNAAASDTGEAVSTAGGFLSKLSGIGKTLISTVGNIAIAMAATAVIQGIISFIYDVINAEEIAIQKGKEAREAISEINSGYKKTEDFTKNNVDRYLELRSKTGVSSAGDIENRNLSTDEFEEFLDLNRELSALFPSLVTGFDAQGNAMLDLSSDADSAKDSISALLEQERQLADFKIGEQLSAATQGFITRYEQLQKDINLQNSIIEAGQTIQGAINDAEQEKDVDLTKLGVDEYGTLRWEYDPNNRAEQEMVDRITNMYVDAAHEIKKDVNYAGSDSTQGLMVLNLVDGTEDDVEKLQSQFQQTLREAHLDDIPEEIIDAVSTKNIDMSEIKADWNALVPSLISQMDFYDQYKSLGDSTIGQQLQNIIADDIANIDLENLSKNEADWKLLGENPRQLLREKFLDPLVTAFADEQGNFTKESEKNMQKLLNAVFDTDISRKDWKQNIDQVLQELVPGSDQASIDLRQQLRVILGVSYIDESTGEELYSGDALSLAKELNLSLSEIDELSLDDIELIQEAKVTGKFDYKGTGLEDLKKWIEDTKKLKAEAETIGEGTISDILGDQTFSDEADRYEDRISKLTAAIDEYKESGKIDAETKKELTPLFPSLPENYQNDEALFKQMLDTRMDEVAEYVQFMKQAGEDAGLTPKDQDGWNNYIRTIIESLGDLTDSAEGASKLFADLFYPDATDARKKKVIANEFMPRAEELQARLAERGEEINWNVVATLVAQDKFSGDADQILQAYDGEIITWEITADTKRIERELDHISKQRGREEARLGRTEASGKILGSDQYNTTIRLDREEVSLQEQAVQNAYKDYRRKVEQNAPEQVVQKAADAYAEAQSAVYQSQTNLYGDLAKQTEAGVAELKDQIDKTSNDITKYEQEVTNNQKYREKVSENTARELNRLHNEQAESYDTEARFWQDVANFEGTDEEYTNRYGNITRKQAAENANAAKTNAVTSRENADQYTPQQVALDNLKLEYEDFENTIQDVNQQISVKQAKGLKANAKDYKNLVNLTKAQISNLKKQNAELKAGGKLTKDQQDLYRQNEASINNLYSTLADYEKTAKNLVVSDAQNLAQAISSAFSEMTTETGLGTDTMASLLSGFSDLGDAADLASIFYGTADGVKADLIQLERLAKQQSVLVNQDLDTKMLKTKAAIEAATEAGNTDRIRELNQELAEYQRQQAQYYATYAEQMENFSHLAAIARADQTENEGADYETAQGYMKTAKDLFDKGLIGTDDFKERAAYLDPYGRTDWKTFEQNYKKAERYFTDDASGVQHFLDDLKAKGLATYDELTGYTLDFADATKAALEMGMSGEFFEDVMTRLNDYGGNIQYVSSLEEAAVKTSDLKVQIADANIQLARMMAEGASEEAIATQQAHIDELTGSLNNLTGATENYKRGAQAAFAQRFENLPDTVAKLKELHDAALEAGDVEIAKKYRDEIEALGEEFHVKINADLTIDKDSLEAQVEAMKPKIDLQNRLQVDAQKLRDVGWKNVGEGTATVYTSSYSSEDGQKTVVMTPILPNGDVYEPQALAEYAQQMLDGMPDTEGLKLRIYDGPEAEQQAAAYAEGLHRVQEAWYEGGELRDKLATKLKDYSEEELRAIDYTDNRYDETNQRAAEAEQAVDELMEAFGMTGKSAQEFIDIMKDMGLLNGPSTYAEQMYELDDATKETIASIARGTEVLKEMQDAGDIHLALDVDTDFSQITDNKVIARQIGELEQTKFRLQLQGELTPDTENAINAMIQRGNWQMTINTILSGDTTIEELRNWSDDQLRTTFNIKADSKDAELQLMMLKEQIAGLSDTPASIQIKIDEEQLNSLINAIRGEIESEEVEMPISGDDSLLQKVVNKAKSGIEKLKAILHIGGDGSNAKKEGDSVAGYVSGKKPVMKVRADGTQAKNEANSIAGYISSRNPSINVTANTSTLKASISGALAGTWGIHVAAHVTGISGALAGLKTGTAAGTFRANASGTAYNVINTIPAHAKGADVAIDKDQTSLINEVGTEGLIRNGVFSLIPGGIHTMQLKKGDVILNSEQVKALMNTGRASGKGKVVGGVRALAQGSIYNGMPAHAEKTTGVLGGIQFKPGTHGANTATNANTTATNNNTKATNANTKATEEAKTGLDKFKEWGEKWKDWVEVRLERLQQIVDRTTAKSENEIATTKQNKLLQQAMEVIGNPTNPSKSKRDTLIGDNLAGAARYQKHADLVRQEAINDGLVTAAQADDIIAKIKSGVIDLEQYEEGPREFISSYTEWYDKIVQCTDAIEDLKSQLKDLEQQKLDNITDIYDALVGRNKAIQDSSVAMANFYTATGKVVNSKYFKDELNNQIRVQKGITGHYKKEIERYQKELAYAEKVFGKNSQQYIEAATTLQEMRTSLTESRTATKDLQKALQDLDITKIEYLLDRITNFTSKLGAILSRVQTKGQSYGQSDTDYNTRQSSLMYRQIDYNNSAIEAYGAEIDKRIQQIQENGWQVDSEQYKEAVDWIQKAEIECENLAQTNEELKQGIRDLRWEPFKELQRTVKNVTGDMEHLADLISDAEVFDIGDGTIITDRGLTKLALFATQMQKNNEYIANERAALKKLQEEYENNIISKQKYNEESEEMIKSIQDTVRANNALEKSITDVYKTQIQNENKSLQELIQLRERSLSAKKNYYEYNKTLRGKNKELAQLRAEAAALQGVNLLPIFI